MTRRISSFCLALLALCSSLRADTAVTLRGTVIDPGGRPVPGARVWIDDWTIIDPPPANAVAGADGGFAIPGLLDRPQFLVICAEGFLQADEIVPFPGEPVQITLMKPAARVRGRVLGPDGEPLPGARVRALPSTYNGGIVTIGARACPAEDFATADAEGRVAFGRLEPVQTRLLATAEGLRPGATDWFELEAGQPVKEHKIQLREGEILRGRMLDPAGEPIPGAVVKTTVESSTLEAVAGADGTFTLSGLEEGQLHLYAWAEHFQNRTVDIDEWPDEETLDAEPVEIVLEQEEAAIQAPQAAETIAPAPNRASVDLPPPPEWEVSGRVLDPEGRPVARTPLFLVNAEGKSHSAAWTHFDGTFSLRVPAGDFLLSVSHEGLSRSVPLRVRSGPVAGFDVHLQSTAEEDGPEVP